MPLMGRHCNVLSFLNTELVQVVKIYRYDNAAFIRDIIECMIL